VRPVACLSGAGAPARVPAAPLTTTAERRSCKMQNRAERFPAHRKAEAAERRPTPAHSGGRLTPWRDCPF
jgi:hypothetical protein